MSLSFLVQIIYCKLLAAESQIQVIIGSVLLKLKRSSQKSDTWIHTELVPARLILYPARNTAE